MKSTAIILMLVSIISRIFGFIREMLMSNYYGTSAVAEVVVIALAVPTVLFAFLFNSLNTSFIPSYNRVVEDKGEKAANDFTANIANVVMIFSVFLCIIGIVFARPLVFAMASGFTGEKQIMAIKFVRIVLLGSAFNSIAAIFTGYLNVHDSYILPSARLALQNIILIIFTIISVYTNEYMIAVGILIATIFQNLVLLPALKKTGYSHKWKIDLKDPNIRYILILAIPLMLGVAVDQINVFVDKTLASRAIEGGVAVLNYADRINALVYIVLTSIVTVAYPVISKCAISGDMKGLKKNVFKYAQINYLFCIPVIAAFIVFAEPIVHVIYEGGKFSHNDTIAVSQCLMLYSLTIFGASLREIVSRTFYCMGDSKTPVKNGMVMVALNAILSIAFSQKIGLKGIALGTSTASIIGCLTLTYKLRKKIGRLNTKEFIKNFAKIMAISIVMITLSRLLYNQLNIYISVFKSLAISASFGVIIYFSMIALFDISNSREVIKSAALRLKKKS